ASLFVLMLPSLSRSTLFPYTTLFRSYDVFCSGTASLFDGRSLIVGGTSDYSFTGENRASIFNPATSQYVQSQNMVDGRWYATARSEEHTSELQSRENLVCRLLLEKKK